jgi:hypothetical protein
MQRFFVEFLTRIFISQIARAVEVLIKKSGLSEAEVLRRLVIIGLKNLKEPADLLRIYS